MRTGLTLTLVSLFWGWSTVSASPAVRMFPDPRQSISPVAIAEDADGLLWIAADEGVFRFDGNHFLRVEGPFEGPAGITVVGGSNILIAANNGVFQYFRGAVTRVSPEATNTLTKLSDDLVLLLHPGNGRGDWMEAASWNGTQTTIHPQRGRVGWAWLSADGVVWQMCGAYACSLVNNDGLRDAARKGEWAHYQSTHARTVTSVRDPQSPVSLLRAAGGSYVFRNPFTGMASVAWPNGDTKQYMIGEFTRANGRAGLYTDRSGRIWAPGDALWATDGGRLRKQDIPQLDGLQVYCVFEDTRGRIWLGLRLLGLAVLGADPSMESWKMPAAIGDITSLIRQDASTLFATTSKGTLLRKRRAGNWVQVNQDENSQQITQVAPGGGGSLVGAIRMGSPARVTEQGRLRQQFAKDPNVDLRSMRRLVRAPDGSYLVGTSDEPESLLRILNDRVRVVKMPVKEGGVQDIGFDRAGSALVAYTGGICRVTGDSCTPFITGTAALLDSRIRSLGVNASDEFWIAYRSAKGFSRLRLENGHWTARHFTQATGYDSPETQFLRRDHRGWVWRGTTDGLWVSDGRNVEPGDWLRISERDGLPSSAISRFGFLEDADGTIWIGTERGIAHLQPAPSWFEKEKVGITSLRDTQEALLERGILPGTFQEPGTISASFSNFGLLPVQYRLLPLNRRWEVSYGGEMKPRDLSPGHYQLEWAVGQGAAVTRYEFTVKTTLRSRVQSVLLVASTALAFLSLPILVLWWRHRVRSMPPLPDLTEARLAILSPDTHRIVGTTLDDRFKPERLVAQGGFGAVFEGRDSRACGRCAIKIFRREFGDDWLMKRFHQEVAALEAISHPNVVRIYGHGTAPTGAPFLAMEFIEGVTLRDRLRVGALEPNVCGMLLLQLGRALAEIHMHHIYHRDLKPENVMIRTSAPPGHELVLIDFSMAIVKDPDRSMQGISRVGGTVHYMAPEQAVGHAGPEADIYSMAKVLIEMLTGKRLALLFPAAALDLPERVRELLTAERFGLSDPSIEQIVSALQFDPARRPKDAASFVGRITADWRSLDPIGEDSSLRTPAPCSIDGEPDAV